MSNFINISADIESLGLHSTANPITCICAVTDRDDEFGMYWDPSVNNEADLLDEFFDWVEAIRLKYKKDVKIIKGLTSKEKVLKLV